MVTTQLRRQFQKFGHWILLSVSVVTVAVILAGPSLTNSGANVAWHGRRVYRAYYAPVVPVVPVVPVYRPVIRRAYYAPVVPIVPVAPVYYGAPYGGAVVTPYAEVYW